jgi:HNH endonuclease
LRKRGENGNSSVTAALSVEIAFQGFLTWQKLRCYNGIMKTKLIETMSDQELLADLRTAAASERRATAHLIALLAEMDVRRLYLGEGYSSLFTYCTQCLHLSEHAAYGRIEAARTAIKFPSVLLLLTEGAITLTTVCLLANHLTNENCHEVLNAARRKSKREVEQQVAALAPRPDVASRLQKLPVSTARRAPQPVVEGATPNGPIVSDTVVARPPGAQPRPSQPAVVPLAPERYKVQITISTEAHDKLRRVQDLMRHDVPNGDPAVIFDRALTLLLNHLERRKLAQVDHPRACGSRQRKGRHIPAAVRREVWARDQGRCAFVGSDGRCTKRGFLEFHHVIPFADEGPTTVENLQLRCRAHNAYEAREHFGAFFLREHPFELALGLDRVDSWHNIGASSRVPRMKFSVGPRLFRVTGDAALRLGPHVRRAVQADTRQALPPQ